MAKDSPAASGYAAGRQLFADFVARDMPGSGAWRIEAIRIEPYAPPCPTIEFVSLSDRIVPHKSAASLADHRDLGAGHVGIVVGSRARTRLWEQLAQWLRDA